MKFLISFLFIFSTATEIHVSYWLLISHDDSNTIALQKKMHNKAICVAQRDMIYDTYKPLGYTVKCEQVS